ncbi:hypothetical protein HHK36_025195 [Tetracentron sinense]|uniref:Uncharacterized protein n=1 Tax=Tetracentron sinense TaxID=13715 RepID=A0A834YQF3_TETSI|nr:hypothetical protein HHK36_025195 [Tetracentron sinense]
MEEQPKATESGEKRGGFTLIGDDLLRNILSRLPALSYASAACVSRSWNHLCNEILSRPKILSALSLNPRLEVAVKEVLDKVLSEPIQPHFAIACIGQGFSLKKTHQLVRARLSTRIPIITSEAPGIIGRDALSNEFKEVQWEEDDSGLNEEIHNLPANVNRGIILIVGFMPGLKVNAIPLLLSKEELPQVSMIEKFVMNIKDYTASASGCTSPTGILMFGDQRSDLKPVLDKLDFALSAETVILGNESGCFLYSNGDDSRIVGGGRAYILCENTEEQIYQNCKCGAVALVFARDRDKSQGIGEIHFHLALSTGVSPVGPTYKGASVRVLKGNESDCSTWLTARREGSLEKLDGQRILQNIDYEVENDSIYDLYVGVTKRRKCSIGSGKGRLVSSLAFHEVLGVDDEYLYVKGEGIKTGDSFCLYRSNSETAITSRNDVFESLKTLKHDWGCNHMRGVADDGDNKLVCGGLIFSCYGRGESFFGYKNVDSSAFLDNFPGVQLAGMFCGGEIGRGSSISIRRDEGQEQSLIRCCLHVYSTAYLVISYSPRSQE